MNDRSNECKYYLEGDMLHREVKSFREDCSNEKKIVSFVGTF